MGSWISSTAQLVADGDRDEMKSAIEQMIKQDKVVIFSKTTCPYCIDAKRCFDKLNVKYTAFELNKHAQGSVVQDILMELTGARTVPRVFVNGSFIGGGSETVSLYNSGQLQKLCEK